MDTICFFNTCKSWGGGEKWHLDISKRMQTKRNVILITFPNSELAQKAKKNNIKYFEVKTSKLSFLNISTILKVKKIFEEENVGTVIMNLSSDMKLASIGAKWAKVPNVIYRRGSAIPIKNSLINRYLFRNNITKVIANSKETKRTINAKNPNLFPGDRIHVIYNGIEINSTIKPTHKKHNPSLLTIGNAGRLFRQKAQHYLIELGVILKNRKIPFKIIIAGEGVERNNLQNLISKNNLDNEIKLIGFQSDLDSFYENIDLFILTSLWEGFGYVLVEAMEHGKPCIAFNTSSNSEIIQDNKSGLIIESFNLEQMADSVEKLFNDNALYAKFSKESTHIATNNFSIDRVIKELEDLI